MIIQVIFKVRSTLCLRPTSIVTLHFTSNALLHNPMMLPTVACSATHALCGVRARPRGDDPLSKGRQRRGDSRSTWAPGSRTPFLALLFQQENSLGYHLPSSHCHPSPRDLIRDPFPFRPPLSKHSFLSEPLFESQREPTFQAAGFY